MELPSRLVRNHPYRLADVRFGSEADIHLKHSSAIARYSAAVFMELPPRQHADCAQSAFTD
jgi:hypothetical protein